MSSIETVFLSAVYGLYLVDCIVWIAPGETLLTRSGRDTWRAHTSEPLSFTLAGRRPLLTAPLLVRPGVLRLKADAVARCQAPSPRSLLRVARRLGRLHLLLTLCRGQALLLLVYLPLLLLTHRLVVVWPIFVAFLALVHLALSTLAIRALRAAGSGALLTSATSVLLNPLGATRVFDLIAQALCDQQKRRDSHRESATVSRQ